MRRRGRNQPQGTSTLELQAAGPKSPLRLVVGWHAIEGRISHFDPPSPAITVSFNRHQDDREVASACPARPPKVAHMSCAHCRWCC